VARYTILLFPEEGRYSVLVPALDNLATQGDTVEEALAMSREAIELYLRGLMEDDDYVPVEEEPPIIATLDVAVPDPATVARRERVATP
jgi:antitoxin HicB